MNKRWIIAFLMTMFLLSAVVFPAFASDGETVRSLTVNKKLELEPESSPDPAAGIYVGFGEAAAGGGSFSLQTAFPRFVDNNSRTVPVNIYVMAQFPNGYLYFLRPEGRFEPGVYPWAKGVTVSSQETAIPSFPLVNPLTGENTLEPGTYTFSTLVVSAERAVDLSDLNWEFDPMELSFYEVDILPLWVKK